MATRGRPHITPSILNAARFFVHMRNFHLGRYATRDETDALALHIIMNLPAIQMRRLVKARQRDSETPKQIDRRCGDAYRNALRICNEFAGAT
jgi:hypothetical protein